MSVTTTLGKLTQTSYQKIVNTLNRNVGVQRELFVSIRNTFSTCHLLSQHLVGSGSVRGGGRHLSTYGASAAESDVELSYTTYPDKEHEENVDKSKTPLVFLHGLFGAKGNLHSVCKHLSEGGRKIIPFDARNHGDSDRHPNMTFPAMAEDLIGLINDLELDLPVVMGHSMGGKTAMTAALSRPECMSALIVSDVMPLPSPNMEMFKKLLQVMKAVEIPKGTSIIQARRMARTQLAPSVTSIGVLQFILTNLKQYEDGCVRWRVNLDAVMDSLDHIGGFPLIKDPPFTKPTLFVFGENSEHYWPSDIDSILELFPTAEIRTIPDAGHFIHADKPLEFVQIVNDFLDSLQAKSSS